jgi:hypothetical protein
LGKPHGFALIFHRSAQYLPSHFLFQVTGQRGFSLAKRFEHRLFINKIRFLLIGFSQVDPGLMRPKFSRGCIRLAAVVGEGR